MQLMNFNGEYYETNIHGEKYIFVKPLSYMNLSGGVVSQFVKFFKLTYKDVLVIHDDLDMDVSRIKIKVNSSAGGHNGIKDIINKLGSDKFVRFKIGIGHPKQVTVIDHVLTKFSPQEREALKLPISKAVEFVKLSLCAPMNIAISKVNRGN